MGMGQARHRQPDYALFQVISTLINTAKQWWTRSKSPHSTCVPIRLCVRSLPRRILPILVWIKAYCVFRDMRWKRPRSPFRVALH